MDKNFVLKGGKYNGKTYGWVLQNFPSYISWCKENAPNMLKERPVPVPNIETKEIKFRDEPIKSLVPNLNFWNEGPHELSIPYLIKIKENI